MMQSIKYSLICMVLLFNTSIFAQVKYNVVPHIDSLSSTTSYKDSDNKFIIHLSDIHIYLGEIEKLKKKDSAYRNSNAVFSSVCRNIISRFDSTKTIVVISGDIGASNDPSTLNREFHAARDTIQSTLEKHKFIVLICPGNHDYGTGVWTYSDEKRNAFHSIFEGLSIDMGVDVQCKPRGDLIFVGLNSMHGARKHVVQAIRMSCGKFGKDQLDTLEAKLKTNNSYFKIIFTHHASYSNKGVFTSYFQKARRNRRFRNILKGENGANILLYGHRHRAGYLVVKEKSNDVLHVFESAALPKYKKYTVVELKEKQRN